MSQTVDVSAGAVEYTWPITITETTGKDISADQVQMSLGTYSAPGEWAAPAVVNSPTPASVVVQMLIDSSVAPGVYWLWVRITDAPEVAPRRVDRLTVT